MFRPSVFAAPLLAIVVFASAAASASAAEDELLWRGDHATARTIMDELAKEYAKEKKGKISVTPFSTVSGLDAVAQGTADIAGSARGKYLKRPEEAGINFVPIALDAAVMITHPKNPVNSLTLRQVYDIYYGRITNWTTLGGEPKDINLYGIAAPLDGIEFSVRDLVFRNGDQRVAVPRLYLNTTKLEEGISIDPAGLGLSTLASIHGNAGVKALSIEGIAASQTTIGDGSYPLYITLYLAAKVDSPKQAAIDRFIEFLRSPTATAVLRKHDLVPYSEATDAQARAAARTAFIDTHLGREPGTTAGAIAAVTPAPVAASVPPPTPVSAPRAVLESKSRIAPTAETTEQARANLARAQAAKQEKKEAAARSELKVATAKAEPAPKSEPKPVVKSEPKQPAKKKAAVAKAAKPAARDAAPKPATFGNVDAAAKTAEKPASFGDVDAGTKTSADPHKN